MQMGNGGREEGVWRCLVGVVGGATGAWSDRQTGRQAGEQFCTCTGACG